MARSGRILRTLGSPRQDPPRRLKPAVGSHLAPRRNDCRGRSLAAFHTLAKGGVATGDGKMAEAAPGGREYRVVLAVHPKVALGPAAGARG